MAAHSKKNPQGRSVEEVILLRRLGGNSPGGLSLPMVKTSSSMGSLPGIAGAGRQESAPPTADNKVIRLNTAEAVYTEADVRRMMEEVLQYTRSLQNRVQHLESELSMATRNSTANHVEFAAPVAVIPAATPVSDGRRPSHSATTRATTLAHDAIVNIDSKVLNLKDIFRRKDPLEERLEASIAIQSVIRRFLVQCRRRAYEIAQREWRWARCRPVVWLLDILLSNQSKLDNGFHLLRMNRTMRTLLVFFGKWSFICRQNAPMRRSVRELAAQRIQSKRLGLMRMVFDGLHAVSVGGLSTKNAAMERHKLIDRIRTDLSSELQALGLVGIVPEDEVLRVLHKKVVDQFKERKKVIIKTARFAAFVKLVALAKRNAVSAKKHHFRHLAGRCFYAWSDYIYLKSRGLDRKRWPGPRKYEVRYNQKRVDHFSRTRCERNIFSAWKEYFAIQIIVKRKFQKKKADFIIAVWSSWRAISNSQRALRKKTLDNWMGYGRLITNKPFQAWAEYVQGQKNQYNEHLRIAKAYYRWKQRQKLCWMVRAWRHQALFGRVDGLYSRAMLVRSLGEQKMFTNTLEKCMADQLLELEECKKIVGLEVAKRQGYEGEITKLTADVNKTRMTIHHYEQELKRLQSMLTSLATINPKQMEYMTNLQGEFKFKERNIALGSGLSKMNLAEMTVAGGPAGTPPAVEGTENKTNLPTIPEPSPPDLLTGTSDLLQDEPSVPPSPAAASVPSTAQSVASAVHSAAPDHAPTPPMVAAEEAPKPAKMARGHSTGDVSLLDDEASVDEAASHEPPPAVVVQASVMCEADRLLLDRVRWLVDRYESALLPDHLQAKDLITGTPPADSANASASASENRESAVRSQQQPIRPEPHRSASIVPFRGERPSLFKSSSGSVFAKNPDSEPVIIEGTSMSPTRRLSTLRRPSSFQQGNFSAAMAAAVNSVNALPSQMNNDYYNDEELEDLVIVWAKMLVTFFDFLQTGDITNMPSEDKRLWASYLLGKARAEAAANAAANDSTPSEEPTPDEALVTVDKQMTGIDWRQALLTLRTMFPGSGNFSGLGVPLTSQEDISFGQRILLMNQDIQRIEAQATAKHQKHFVSKHIAGAGSNAVAMLKSRQEDDLTMSVYASNLNRLAELQAEHDEASRYLLSSENTMRRTLPGIELTAGELHGLTEGIDDGSVGSLEP